MDLEKATVSTLFGLNQQFEIPLFQRQYVWDEEYHWKPLWEDLEDVSQRKLLLEPGKQFVHFTGTIVVKQRSAFPGNLPKFEIIDGQQRLTTFQIILCVIRDICESNGDDDLAKDTRGYILNDKRLSNQDDKYKLIPGALNRESFMSLIDERISDSQGQIRKAYDYFKPVIEAYVEGDQEKVKLLFNSLLDSFSLVQILINDDDEPERIFESLNATGEKLLEFDLLRNNLFLRSGENKNEFYSRYWQHFETPYWDPKDKSGTSCEDFLQHFLMAKLGSEKVKPEFYQYKRGYVPKLNAGYGIKHEFSELKRYSDVYTEMIDCSDDSEIGDRMKFYHTFKLTVLHPFIMFLICDVGISGDKLDKVLDILESYTLRRMLCFNGTRGLLRFNIFFSQLIKEYQKNGFTLESFINKLTEQNTKSLKYPTNDEIQPALHTRYDEDYFSEDAYIVFPNNVRVRASLEGLWVETAGAIKLKLIRYILYRIERMKIDENPNLEPITFKNSLTLEHVMPQAWWRKWKLPVSEGAVIYDESGSNYRVSVNREGEHEALLYADLFSNDYKASTPDWRTNPSKTGLADPSYSDAYNLASVRDHCLNSIGNLTLATKNLNSKLSNRVFPDRREILDKNSVLRLNKEICCHKVWEVNEIYARADRLIADVCKIWPVLDVFREENS